MYVNKTKKVWPKQQVQIIVKQLLLLLAFYYDANSNSEKVKEI